MLRFDSSKGFVTVSFRGLVIDEASPTETLSGVLSLDLLTGGMTLIVSQPQTAEAEAIVIKAQVAFEEFKRHRKEMLDALASCESSFDC